MATIINNDSTAPSNERVVRVEGSSDAGWAIAVIILIAVLIGGGYLFMRYRGAPAAAPASNGGASINVTLPSGDTTGGGSDTSGGASGGAAQ